MLTLCAVVCAPNKVIPFEFRCAAIWAGPVSLATTKALSFISVASCEILRDLLFNKIGSASKSLEFLISEGPGAVTILNSSLYLFLIS